MSVEKPGACPIPGNLSMLGPTRKPFRAAPNVKWPHPTNLQEMNGISNCLLFQVALLVETMPPKAVRNGIQ